MCLLLECAYPVAFQPGIADGSLQSRVHRYQTVDIVANVLVCDASTCCVCKGYLADLACVNANHSVKAFLSLMTHVVAFAYHNVAGILIVIMFLQ